MLLDLSPFVERDLTPDDIADFFPTTWEGGQLQFGPKAGLRFGMPRHVNVGLLWFNKNHFDNAGLPYPTDLWSRQEWTWDTFVESAMKLTVRDATGVTRWGADEIFTNMRWSVYVWGAGGDITNWPNRPLQLLLDRNEVVDGLTFAQRLRWEYRVMPPEPGSAEDFVNQKSSMLFNRYFAPSGNRTHRFLSNML